MNERHRPHPLAQSGPCTIEACDCGVLHVTVGMLTMRLQPTTARALAEALGHALAITENPAIEALERVRWSD